MKSYIFSFVRVFELWSYKESGLIEKFCQYCLQYIYGGTFENVVLQGGRCYKEWSYSETGLYSLLKVGRGNQLCRMLVKIFI